MKYLVDTTWGIDYLTGQKAADDLFTALMPGGLAISVVTFSEVYEGIYGSRNPKRAEATFSTFLRKGAVLGVSRGVAKRNGLVRMELRRQRREVTHRAFDILIAATALEHDLTLVTRNLTHYDDIPSLRLYQPGRDADLKRLHRL